MRSLIACTVIFLLAPLASAADKPLSTAKPVAKNVIILVANPYFPNMPGVARAGTW